MCFQLICCFTVSLESTTTLKLTTRLAYNAGYEDSEYPWFQSIA